MKEMGCKVFSTVFISGTGDKDTVLCLPSTPKLTKRKAEKAVINVALLSPASKEMIKGA